jgi:hypothetical protein
MAGLRYLTPGSMGAPTDGVRRERTMRGTIEEIQVVKVNRLMAISDQSPISQWNVGGQTGIGWGCSIHRSAYGRRDLKQIDVALLGDDLRRSSSLESPASYARIGILSAPHECTPPDSLDWTTPVHTPRSTLDVYRSHKGRAGCQPAQRRRFRVDTEALTSHDLGHETGYLSGSCNSRVSEKACGCDWPRLHTASISTMS